jgi:CsoR family transcriptional regulator, copper-sensing transcriptional repressor
VTTEPVDAFRQTPTTPGYAGRKRDHLSRLTKVEGQVRGVARMVEQDRYCIEVLTQIAAATKALQQVALGLLDDHMRHCVTDAVHSSTEQGDARLTEVNRAISLALRV